MENQIFKLKYALNSQHFHLESILKLFLFQVKIWLKNYNNKDKKRLKNSIIRLL
jgi:hypothetical protein